MTEFSIAMSVYKNDNPQHFSRAIESITINQTIMPSEVILVVDGPVSKEINCVIDEFAMKYDFIHIIRLTENRGLGNALRVAVETARYGLVARMDSDDVSLPDRFERQLKVFANNPKIDIVGGDISEFDCDENSIIAYRRVPQNDIDIKKFLKERCPFNHMSVMFRKSAIQAAGGYIDLFWNEDYYLWIRMAECDAVMANTGTVLVNVRVGRDMYNRRGGAKYFASELFLQKYMFEHKIINRRLYLANVGKRWIIQRVVPNRLRGWLYTLFAREK